MPEFFVNGIVFAVLLTHTNIDARVFRQPSLLFLRYSLGPDCAQNGPVLALCEEYPVLHNVGSELAPSVSWETVKLSKTSVGPSSSWETNTMSDLSWPPALARKQILSKT